MKRTISPSKAIIESVNARYALKNTEERKRTILSALIGTIIGLGLAYVLFEYVGKTILNHYFK